MPYSWGGLPIPGPNQTLEGDWAFQALTPEPTTGTLLPYGRGRSYGDSCINSHASHISTRQLDRFIAFDSQAGILECEAGLSLLDILQVIVPQGWFLPVVPGTSHITLGGAIANDVHGKNHHHAGSFGCHIQSLELLRSDGQRPKCSLAENAALFAATIGGLGLTGLITRATLKLFSISSERLVYEDLPFENLAQFTQLSQESVTWDYTVAWIDTTAAAPGRGIFSRARHAEEASGRDRNSPGLRPGVPFTPPFSLICKPSVKLFNNAYFRGKSRNSGATTGPYQPFFFPLDAIANWNRIYGKAGFYQYQCVIPPEEGIEAVQQLLEDIQASGQGSFLSVLKEFGHQRSPGLLSFPRPGLTLALDFPNQGEKTLHLLGKLDTIVSAAGGALYPAKDARMSTAIFRSSFPKVDEFKQYIDPNFSSSFWRRVQV